MSDAAACVELNGNPQEPTQYESCEADFPASCLEC